jgi:hypothetical protein
MVCFLSYRYDDSDDALEHPSIATRHSQGADISDWLQQHPPQDPMYHTRQRVNLFRDVGLPPAEADSLQGLSFDLEGLAACLESIPLYHVLRLPKELYGEHDGDTHVKGEENESDVEEIETPANVAASLEKVAIEEKPQPILASISVSEKPQKPPIPPPKASTKDDNDITSIVAEDDDELDMLLGMKAKEIENSAAVAAAPSKDSADAGTSLEEWLDGL